MNGRLHSLPCHWQSSCRDRKNEPLFSLPYISLDVAASMRPMLLCLLFGPQQPRNQFSFDCSVSVFIAPSESFLHTELLILSGLGIHHE